jgi:soluble lytic murein transglycosylase-like protein
MSQPTKTPRFLALLATAATFALLTTPSLFAADVAHLSNGFTIAHRSHEVRGTLVRLYLDDSKTSYVELPVGEIAGYSVQPDLPQRNFRQPAAMATNAGRSGQAAAPGNEAAVEAFTDTAQLVREAGDRNGVDADFLASVIRQESGGNPRAVSRAGARGLMQLMPATAAQMGVEDSFNPEENVHGGARYLRELLERYRGDAIRALAAYNAGPEAVDRYDGVPPFPETRRYVRQVVTDYNSKKKARAEASQQSGEHGQSRPAAAISGHR